MQHHAARRERLAAALAAEGLDALLVSHPVNVTWATGFTGDSTALILTRDRALVVSDPRYIGQLADECPEVPTHIREPVRKLPDAIGDALASLGARRVGCESAALTLADAEALRAAAPLVDWAPASDRAEKLRMVKDAVEIEEIRAAVAIAERAFAAFRAIVRPDDTEKDLADALDALMRRCGAPCAGFPPIIAVGERAALPHCPPTGKRVRESNVLLVDWGADGPGRYKSDLTRVLRGPGPATMTGPTLERVHDVVLRANRAAIAAVRPGAIAKDIDAAARSLIASEGLGAQFTHGLGHGVGLQIHEAPSIRPLSETVLEPGMVFTIEPGVYLPGMGGVRIEDDVLVTADGCEVLTGVARDLGA